MLGFLIRPYADHDFIGSYKLADGHIYQLTSDETGVQVYSYSLKGGNL